MTNNSILIAVDRLWQHIVDLVAGKADKDYVDDVIANNAVDLSPYETKEDASTKLQEAKDYTDSRIPTVNNGTLTIKQNGSAAKTFTANSASNVEVNIVTPTKLSDLSEDDNHRTVTLEEKTKLESAVTTTEFNKALLKAEAELNKRPIAYAPIKGELNWEFSGNIDDYESIVLDSLSDETYTSIMIAVKVLDVAPSAEERELISFISYLGEALGTSTQTNGQWSPFNGDERAYAVFLNGGGSLPMIAAVYSTISEGEITITPGLWVIQVQVNGENGLGVQSLNAPMVTLDGVKMSADLIDAEWMAIETQSDLDITISNENADSFELFAGTIPKLSDYAPTIEQIKTSTFTAVLLDGTVQEMQITDDMIYHDDEMPPDMYIVNDFLLIIGSETTIEGITLSKGMYLLGPVSDFLNAM
jgi:hypothetical protein